MSKIGQYIVEMQEAHNNNKCLHWCQKCIDEKRLWESMKGNISESKEEREVV